jgi:hypothetical protein
MRPRALIAIRRRCRESAVDERAVAEVLGCQRAADENKCRALDALRFYLRGNVGKSAAYNALRRRTRLNDDGYWTIGAADRRQLADYILNRVNREVDNQRGAGCGEGRELFLLRHARGAS